MDFEKKKKKIDRIAVKDKEPRNRRVEDEWTDNRMINVFTSLHLYINIWQFLLAGM